MHECPLIPMGAITGKPSKAILTETLEAYRAQGITQFLIYPRSGCELEYLSDDWFGVCEHIITEATRLGFTSLWLYDEYNWPSGTCNKQIPQLHPEFAAQQLCAYPENGDIKTVVRKNPRMTDLMNPDAVDCFIAMTHDQYARRFSKYLGTLIKGFFTDEPDIAFFSYDHKEDILRMPYYSGLPEDYQRETGSDLFADIRTGLKNHSDFYQPVCNRLCAEKFRANFAERLSAWCARHNMVLTGHLMNEYSSNLALRCNGHPLRVLSAFSQPGMDEIFTQRSVATIEWLTLGTVMYAVEQRGNHGGLAELFALGPCDLTPAQIRRQLWLKALFGINRYVMAVAHLDSRGSAERKAYFHPFTRTQPWFLAYDALGAEATRAAAYATKSRKHRIGVRYPYAPAPLTDLLKHLTALQYDWTLLLPDETTDCDAVIRCQDGGIVEERTQRLFFDIGCLEHDLLATMPLRSAWISNADGQLADELFIRCFQDGSVVVLDFSGRDRQLRLNRAGMQTVFCLPAEGVICFPGWAVTLDHPNTLRADFVNGQFAFDLLAPCPDLHIALRHCADLPEVLLDGAPLPATRPCTGLPQGFNEIYLASDNLALAAGSHVLELKNVCDDLPYLPLAWLVGTFARESQNRLAPYQNDGLGLAGYAGAITQRAKVSIPPDALRLNVDPQGMATELRINGQSLGKRLWPPFTWILPSDTPGTSADIEIIRYSSCGQIFGQKAFTSDDHAHPWLKAYAPNNATAPKPFCEVHLL
ncbi:MAG: hypothetical protein GX617_03580 [Lentisphaerae bacterium]|nr:hypothetical protein [Lentisphaerota bacterium]